MSFFPKDTQSIENLVEIFNTFSLFSGLKPNLTKCEIAGIGALKGVQVAVCGTRCIDLCNEAIKILGTYVSCNSRIKKESNFLKIVSIVQSALNLWRYRNLTLEGRIVVFKSLAISKIVFQALIAPVPTHVIKALETIQTSFLWNNSNPKIKHKTLCKRYENGSLKNVGIRNKVNSLQSSWVKKLYDDYFREWKIIPLHQLNKFFGSSFKFHSSLSFKKSSLKKLLPFCRHMLNSWSQSLSGSPEISSQISSQFLWFNKYIKIEGTVIHFPKFSNKGINFLSQLFENGRIISWINLKDRYELTNNMFFQWAQLKHPIPPRWKKIIFDYSEINENDLCQNHHVIKGDRILQIFLTDFPLRKCIQF